MAIYVRAGARILPCWSHVFKGARPEAIFSRDILNVLIYFAATSHHGQVAQLVEHMTENHGVGGSIPSLATT
jgi:hypothetical protein